MSTGRTDLDAIRRAFGIETVVFATSATTVVALSTVRHSHADHRLVIVERIAEGTTSFSDEHARWDEARAGEDACSL